MPKSFWKERRILVTGSEGFVGRHLIAEMLRLGIPKGRIIAPSRNDADLRIRRNCVALTKSADIVIHLAGNVGGIGKNRREPGELFYDNAVMGIELMEAARKNGVQKFVTLGTVCAYPKYTSPPFSEEDLWHGYPEETNAPYGLAKKILLVQSQAYRKQYGFNGIYLIPVNLYGPGDNFDLEDSHVIPAMIRKFYEAKLKRRKQVELWGDGTPTREFLYVEDAVRGILLATERYNSPEPVNLGSGAEISIRNLAETIALRIGYEGMISWDIAKPNGQPRRLLDVSKAKKEFGFTARTPLNEGLKKTIAWYVRHRKYI